MTLEERRELHDMFVGEVSALRDTLEGIRSCLSDIADHLETLTKKGNNENGN